MMRVRVVDATAKKELRRRRRVVCDAVVVVAQANYGTASCMHLVNHARMLLKQRIECQYLLLQTQTRVVSAEKLRVLLLQLLPHQCREVGLHTRVLVQNRNNFTLVHVQLLPGDRRRHTAGKEQAEVSVHSLVTVLPHQTEDTDGGCRDRSAPTRVQCVPHALAFKPRPLRSSACCVHPVPSQQPKLPPRDRRRSLVETHLQAPLHQILNQLDLRGANPLLQHPVAPCGQARRRGRGPGLWRL